MFSFLNSYLKKDSDSMPLAVFRIAYGFLMFISILRFWNKGWIEELYLAPSFHFSYFGFEWVKPLGEFTYLVFFICGLSSLFVGLGFKYRWSIVIFFLSFTYIELMDKTTYLNHYYFISISSFLMIFLPANARLSIDNFISGKFYQNVPKWTLDALKLLISIVYIYAGIAKINSDWLFRAMPLKIWLPSKYDLPLIGDSLLQSEFIHYLMSWGGMCYDLLIPFLLLNKRTRGFGFLLVVFFHAFTKVLFPIGMFPYIMIASALVFFDANFHKKVVDWVIKFFEIFKIKTSSLIKKAYSSQPFHYKYPKFTLLIVSVFLLFQMLIPFRYFLYPGELFWHEQGYRFSWRVMLIEKMGYTTFKVTNSATGGFFYVNNQDFLTPFQEKQMSFQPDFILEYAHHLGSHFKEMGHQNVEVYAESYVSLNGRRSTRFIDQKIDLLTQKRSLRNYAWILPFNDEINGF